MQSNYKYAKTIFDLSKQSNSIPMIQNQMKIISYLYNKIAAFRLVFITKRINSEDKIKIIKNTLNDFEPLIVELIAILIQNNQTNNLLDVFSKFDSMANTDSKLNKIEITTSEKMTDEELEHISKTISEKLNANPNIRVNVDSNIIGGMKLRVGNKIFDNSVNYQIKQLKKTLHNV
tara:strand:- start:1265 stop:1792 length:528 start_codon:yes stop_codon:yes gene_type:complete